METLNYPKMQMALKTSSECPLCGPLHVTT